MRRIPLRKFRQSHDHRQGVIDPVLDLTELVVERLKLLTSHVESCVGHLEELRMKKFLWRQAMAFALFAGSDKCRKDASGSYQNHGRAHA
jgi:hypothetical protein